MAKTEGIEMMRLPPVTYISGWGALTPRALKPGRHTSQTQVDYAETYSRATQDFTNIIERHSDSKATHPDQIKFFKPIDNPVLGTMNSLHTWFRQASVSVTFSGFQLKSGHQVLGGILTIPTRAASKPCGGCVKCFNRAKKSDYSTLPVDQPDCGDDDDDNSDQGKLHLVMHVDPDNPGQGTNTSKPVSCVKRIERMVRIPDYRRYAASQSTTRNMKETTGHWTLKDCEADTKRALWKSSGVEVKMTVHYDHLVFGKVASSAKDAWIAQHDAGRRIGAGADGSAKFPCRVEGLVLLTPHTDAPASSSGPRG